MSLKIVKETPPIPSIQGQVKSAYMHHQVGLPMKSTYFGAQQSLYKEGLDLSQEDTNKHLRSSI